ncbi:MAG: EAL domain-containing protein [Desulfuromonadales bacterium]
MAVNVSARQFQNEKFVEQVDRILEESGLASQWLDIELTESMLMKNPESAVQIMKRLKELGLGLDLDDFGTGYSSLSYLQRFPVDRLKIDRSFISEVTTDPENAAVASSIVAVAHNLKLNVVAEGVETVEQLEFLRNCNCYSYQGFLFSRPVPAEEFKILLQNP